MLVLASGGVGLSLTAWGCARDRWRGRGGLGAVLRGLGAVARHPQTWLVALAGLGTSSPLLGFAELWGVRFLETAHGVPRTFAATLTSLPFVGWGVGAALLGWLSDRIGRRKLPLFAGLALETVALMALVYLPDLTPSALTLLCCLIGFFGSGQIVCFALVKENHPVGLSGTAIGFVNSMVTGAGALFQPLVGLLLDLAWDGSFAHGARVYDSAAYRLALASLLACCLAGLLCLPAVRETFCRNARD